MVALKTKGLEERLSDQLREYNISISLRHQNILRFLRILHDEENLHDSKRLFLVMETVNIFPLMTQLKEHELNFDFNNPQARLRSSGAFKRLSAFTVNNNQGKLKHQSGFYSRDSLQIPELKSSKKASGTLLRRVVTTLSFKSSSSLEPLPLSHYKTYTDEACFTAEEAKKILLPIVEALAYVHQKGIIHFDIKPENIVLQRHKHFSRPIPKLIDFGISRHVADLSLDSNGLTKRYRKGTIGFMSFDRYYKRFDPFADEIWCLGATYFTMTSGQWILGREGVKRGEEEFVQRRILNLSHDSKIVEKLCACEPRDRPKLREVSKIFKDTTLT